jgi:hypothetical protein
VALISAAEKVAGQLGVEHSFPLTSRGNERRP